MTATIFSEHPNRLPQRIHYDNQHFKSVRQFATWSYLSKNDNSMAHTILRLPAVKARTGLARSTIYLRISEGSFPKPIRLGVRTVGWLESEIEAWLSERIKASRRAA